MINHISITNFAIIENTEIDFENGLNIITGETGSGKSIVIEAVSLALGSRADSAFVRHGADKAIVQLQGELNEEEIVITREVSASGKNLCKLNGSIVTLSELSETCRRLADIHGQYDNQTLLNPDNHIKLIDSYLSDKIAPVKETFTAAYSRYREAHTALTKLLSVSAENERKLDFYRFEKHEIDNADLTTGEDDALSERISLLQNSEKIFSGIETAYEVLSESDSGVLTSVGSVLSSLQGISQYSSEISSLSEDFSDIFYKIEDMSASLRNIREKITFTPDELDKVIARLNVIDGLKKKYGGTIESVLDYCEKISAELDQIENYDDIKSKLEKEDNDCYESMKIQAALLTEARRLSADKLQKSIASELCDLNFDSARVDIAFSTPDVIGPGGNDVVEILLSTNKGEPLKPLVKVASGGEISRIMLAIKGVTGTYDRIPTMIFDEIDSGISGVTASVVGKKLIQLSKSHQIICITHLPQIASYGDSNYKIYKESDADSTYTHVDKLSDIDKIDEIARLLGGETISEITRQNAQELISLKEKL